MTAKEMFEALGYVEHPNPNYGKIPSSPYICVSYIIKGLVHSERDKIVFYNDETYDVTCNVDIERHKAITQQMKELGWI